MKNFLIFLAAASFGGFFMPAHGQQLPPAGIKPVQVRMLLFCADSDTVSRPFEYMMEMLAIEAQETPVMLGYLKESRDGEAETIVYFVNEERTTSTIVVTKKNKNREEACIVFSGKSPSGMAISINPNPQFPAKT